MAEATCARCGAVKKAVARGLCRACYQHCQVRGQLAQFGRVRGTFDEMLARARAAETSEGCWPWHTASPTGYPTMTRFGGHAVGAHVASFQAVHGPVPDGMTLDHLCHSNSTGCDGGVECRHRRCVRPEHLEPVTPALQQARRPDKRDNCCGNGHPWTFDNVRWALDGKGCTYRVCKTSSRDNTAAYRLRRQPPREGEPGVASA